MLRLFVFFGLLAWVGWRGVKMSQPRGIRNNNPGNIRYDGTQWQGLAGNDNGYAIFDSAASGLRALAKVLNTYRIKHGLQTVRGIISRWAPVSENDTAAYVDHVSALLAVSPDAPLDFDKDQLLGLMGAIIKHENGKQPYSDAQLMDAAKAAGWAV